MNTVTTLHRLALVICLLLTACAPGPETSPPPADNSFNALGTQLDARVASSSISGYSFVLLDGAGLLYSRAGGRMDGQPLTLERTVPLASASKALAAAAIMTLVDAGRLDLDVPVHNYLPPAVNWPSDPLSNPKARITTRMLLAHTSGLPGLNDTPACVEQPNYNGGLAACVALIASGQVPLAAAPGSAFIYGGADYQVAGLVAVTRSGAASWPAFFNTALAAPLGASSQLFYAAVPNPRIAGGASASAPAYATFLHMLLRGGNGVLSNASVVALASNQLQPPATNAGLNTYSGSNHFTPYPASVASAYPQYGLGFFIEAPARHAGSPGPELSSQGLLGATPWIDFGLGYAAVLLVQEENSGTTVLAASLEIWNELRNFIIGRLG